jgi:predicted enzyme related to lactoylglutathione lyase
MDVFKTDGAFSWNELLTTDPAAALAFYRSLFGWTIEDMPMPDGTYHVIKAGGSAVGGIMKQPPKAAQMPPTWCSYVTVADCDATVRKATELGGKVLHGPEDIPKVGRFAVIQDPQGAFVNVIAYRMEQA